MVRNGHAKIVRNRPPVPAPVPVRAPTVAPPPVGAPLRIDIGCGPNPVEGFVGCDVIAFPRVAHLFHAGRDRWPFADDSVSEAHASHFLEHLTNLDGRWERVRFFNELYRVLSPGSGCLVRTPHWCSNRYYGDPTHKEPWSEMAWYYLSREWRLKEAPHTDVAHNPDGYSCDFEATWGYALHPELLTRNEEYRAYAQTWFKEAIMDMVCTVKAVKPVRGPHGVAPEVTPGVTSNGK